MTRFRRRKAVFFRPAIEALEDRNLLSTYTVDHLADDLVGQGLSGSLRYCINQSADGDTITFGVQGTITLTGGELPISKDLDTEGPGADQVAVSGNHQSRVFDISGGVAVRIARITITDGMAAGAPGQAGGILNTGSRLTIVNDILSNNQAVGVSGNGTGGAINSVSGSTLIVTDSVFVNNQARGNQAAAGAFNIGSRSVATVTGSTFVGNQSIGGDGGSGGLQPGRRDLQRCEHP